MYKQVKKLDGSFYEGIILRVEDNAWVPFDELNKDYQEYLKWLEEGNTPLPADEGTK